MILCRASKLRELGVDPFWHSGSMVMVLRVSSPDSPRWLSFELCPVTSFAAAAVRNLCSSDFPWRPPGIHPDLTDAGERRRSRFGLSTGMGGTSVKGVS
jgi:hypothetical protein